ncbi:3-deoxy-manno-octulosonate cytidylyltransferase [candidate division KSB1 bacterium]|nr:3-deoxy-manno-octulosonate cytidylyltransferase [candidate division KSB1 bacterium]RQV99803.1 MAG: 3-deoxy-manno-octulosonate cytidylyltransferase [candidate division KSB1 bacterium]
MDKIAALIPARWASSRFPGKPVVPIAGKPMIQWVYERTKLATSISDVLVATDDERILHAVKKFGGTAVMTPSALPSGTDRVAYVAKDLDVDAVINVQGDEPLIDPKAIDVLAQTLLADSSTRMATLARKITETSELNDPNIVKVVVDNNNYALYFSRAVVPYARDVEKNAWLLHFPYYDHIGIYAYRKEFLLELTELPISMLEQAEKLEQLRVLENGYKIKIGYVDAQPICVDVPEDVIRVERRIQELGIQ